MTAQPIRVMIVEDSGVIREFLEYLITQDRRLHVAASVGSGEEALAKLDRVAPDVISMDIRLPGIDGFETTKRIMAMRPTPIVVVSASVEAEDLQISINALRAGALSVVEKPVGVRHQDYELLAKRLCTQLVIMSQVQVIRQRTRMRGGTSSTLPTPSKPLTQHKPHELRGIGIVASTGGPNALQQVLGELPRTFPLPIFLVQHITAAFLSGFVHWLDGQCLLNVVEAESGHMPRPGTVYVAPADRHLEVRRSGLWLTADELVCQQRPSGTVLLRSLAESFRESACGVVLTGMGSDGADGMLAIRQAGGYTLAEDESTAVVYGMPEAAVRLGGVSELLPQPEIGPRLIELARIT